MTMPTYIFCRPHGWKNPAPRSKTGVYRRQQRKVWLVSYLHGAGRVNTPIKWDCLSSIGRTAEGWERKASVTVKAENLLGLLRHFLASFGRHYDSCFQIAEKQQFPNGSESDRTGKIMEVKHSKKYDNFSHLFSSSLPLCW